MCGVIYKIINTLNGKMYVGKTTRTVKERFGEHARHKKFLIDKAIMQIRTGKFFSRSYRRVRDA